MKRVKTGGSEVTYPAEQRPLPAGAVLGTDAGRHFIAESTRRLATHLKWPVSQQWIKTFADFANALYPQITRPMRAGDIYRTRFGTVRVVPELEHEECPVFGKAARGVLPYEITVAARAGRQRTKLALTHELLHAADYQVGVPLDHTLLHNIAGILESEVLQKMKGYNA